MNTRTLLFTLSSLHLSTLLSTQLPVPILSLHPPTNPSILHLVH